VVTGVGTYGERVEREPITGVWEQSPQRGSGAEPLVGGAEDEPPEAERFWQNNVKICT